MDKDALIKDLRERVKLLETVADPVQSWIGSYLIYVGDAGGLCDPDFGDVALNTSRVSVPCQLRKNWNKLEDKAKESSHIRYRDALAVAIGPDMSPDDVVRTLRSIAHEIETRGLYIGMKKTGSKLRPKFERQFEPAKHVESVD
jgi:hypothetical protein